MWMERKFKATHGSQAADFAFTQEELFILILKPIFVKEAVDVV